MDIIHDTYISSIQAMIVISLCHYDFRERETSREWQRTLSGRSRCSSSPRIQIRIQERFFSRGAFRVVIHYSWCCAVNRVSPCQSRHLIVLFHHSTKLYSCTQSLMAVPSACLGCKIQLFNPLGQCWIVLVVYMLCVSNFCCHGHGWAWLCCTNCWRPLLLDIQILLSSLPKIAFVVGRMWASNPSKEHPHDWSRCCRCCKDNFSTRSDTRTEVYIVLHSTLYMWN